MCSECGHWGIVHADNAGKCKVEGCACAKFKPTPHPEKCECWSCYAEKTGQST